MTDEHRKRLSTEAEPSAPVRDPVFCDDSGLWVRDPLGNCRPFDINDYESLTSECDAWREDAKVYMRRYGAMLEAEQHVALVIWRRFAPSHSVSFEDDSNRAEYLAAAAEILALGNTSPQSLAAWRAAPGEEVEGDVRPPETPVVGDVLNPDLGEER